MITPLSVLFTGELKVKDAIGSRSAVPPLSVGEVVEATVVGKQGGKMTIMVKGSPMEASSTVPLEAGQTIPVRISQLSPKILMVPVKGGDVADGAQEIVEYVKNFRRDPAILKGIVAAGKDLLSPVNIERYQILMPETDFAAIRERFESLLFSKDTFRNYADKLGLLHEHAIASGNGSNDNLKAMLLKLQEDIQKAVSEKSGAGDALAALEDFAAATVQKIETCQVVNLMSLEKDGLFFLPFSFLLGHEIRTGEFYAATKETGRGKEMRAVLFLDMDHLGRIMAEASLLGGNVKCYFRCEEAQTKDFLARRVSGLKDGLEAVGYQAKDIQCYHERMMDAAKMEVLESLPAYSEAVLNVKA
jgi:hypothetical protein